MLRKLGFWQGSGRRARSPGVPSVAIEITVFWFTEHLVEAQLCGDDVAIKPAEGHKTTTAKCEQDDDGDNH